MNYDAHILSRWEKMPDGTVAPMFDRIFQHDEWEDITVQSNADAANGEIVVLRVVMPKTELDKLKVHPEHACIWCRPVDGDDKTDGPEVAAQVDSRLDRLVSHLPNVQFIRRGRTRGEISDRIRVLLRTQSIERAATLRRVSGNTTV